MKVHTLKVDCNPSHMNVAKRILRYLKGTIDLGLFYPSSIDYKLVNFCDNDFARVIDYI